MCTVRPLKKFSNDLSCSKPLFDAHRPAARQSVSRCQMGSQNAFNSPDSLRGKRAGWHRGAAEWEPEQMGLAYLTRCDLHVASHKARKTAKREHGDARRDMPCAPPPSNPGVNAALEIHRDPGFSGVPSSRTYRHWVEILF